MKIIRVMASLTLSGMLVSVGQSQTTVTAGSPPSAPAGYRWQAVPELSDEFEGAGLDASKWLPYQPYWEGRPPSRFASNNVAVREGQLELRSTALVTNLSRAL